MIKITILEDEDEQAARLTDFLDRYAAERGDLSFTTVRYSRGIELVEHYDCSTDLLLLDIRLPDMLGVEVARRIRSMDQDVIIVFISSFSQYAIDGYEVEALDYMLKPVSFGSFRAKMDRVVNVLGHREQGTVLVFKTREGYARLSASDILYAEVVNHDIYIHTLDQRVVKQWGALSKLEEQLQNDHFARCNACYLVNLRYVQGIQRDDVLVGGEKLAISKPRRKEFLRIFAQYKGGSR